MTTTTTEDRTAKMLERVRALLAKADGTTFSAEAESFRVKADEIMTAYAIEQWQVDDAQDGIGQRTAPIKRSFDFGWFYDTSHRSDLWSLFNSTAHHCRCVIAHRGQDYKDMPVIGLPSDLEYFDVLFTHLMLQMGRQLEPKPDADMSFEENAYVLRAAGTQRMRAIQLLYNANMIPGWDPSETPWDSLDFNGWHRGTTATEKKLRAKVRVAAEKWAKTHDLDSTTDVAPAVWQRSFANGFVQEVNHRLYTMRAAQERSEPGANGPSVAVAIRDIRDMAMALYDEMYPPPTPPKCKEEGCDEPPRYMGYCEEHCKARGIKIPKSKAITYREVRYSRRAMSAGTKAGSKANLSGHPGKGMGGGKGALPR